MVTFSQLLKIGFVIVCWSLNPHIKKRIMLKNSFTNYYYINSVIIATIIQIMYTAFTLSGSFSVFDVELPVSFQQWSLILLSACISVFSSFLASNLLSEINISKLIPSLQPCVIVITVLISYFTGEIILLKQWIGIACIVMGISLTL